VISTWLGGAVVARRGRSAGSTVCVWRCVKRMGSSGRGKGEVLGIEWRSSGSTYGAPGFLARLRLVRNGGNRRPSPAGVCEARNRMQFATRRRFYTAMAGGRVAWPVALSGGNFLLYSERNARTATAEQACMRSVPAPGRRRLLSRRWRDLRERPGTASSGAGA